MFRYFFKCAYQGTGYKGSQKQCAHKTIYGTIETELKNVFKLNLRCIPCGRTDAGVHADTSIFHCDFQFQFNERVILTSLNKRLIPQGILIRDIYQVTNCVHALSDVCYREYTYYFTNDSCIPSTLLNTITYLPESFNFFPTSKELNQCFMGTHNFFALSNFGADTESYCRTILNVDFKCVTFPSIRGDGVVVYAFVITGHSFLYKMVRHMVGLLLHSMIYFTNISRLNDHFMINRPCSYAIAPVYGLHLTDVCYKNYKNQGGK